MGPALSQREFDTWREQDNVFKQEMRQLMVSHAALHLTTENRLTKVESDQEKCKSSTAARALAVSSVVSALIGGVAAWLSK